MRMQVVAQSSDRFSIMKAPVDIEKGLCVVLFIGGGDIAPATLWQSVLARGYWEEAILDLETALILTKATEEQIREAFKKGEKLQSELGT